MYVIVSMDAFMRRGFALLLLHYKSLQKPNGLLTVTNVIFQTRVEELLGCFCFRV